MSSSVIVLSENLPKSLDTEISYIGLGETFLVFESPEDMQDYLNSCCDCEAPQLYQPKGITAMMMKLNTCMKCRRLPRKYK